jgi:ElaB/YqjD/DUF883 family membrane-anchored ribosome-binding protein
MGKDPDDIREEIEHTRADMTETVEAIGYKADVPSRAKEAVADKVDAARSKVSEATSRAKQAVSGTAAKAGDATPSGGQAKQRAKQRARQAAGLAQENPLGLAVGAAALGFLAGLLVPSTRVEDERLGPVADQVKDQVKETGQETLERGKQVAQEATRSAVRTAKDRGQEHGQDLAASARQGAREVRDQASPS